MIRLAEFDNARVALAFVDYLKLQGVECQLIKDQEQFAIYLKDAKQELKARQELEQFVQNPNQAKYLEASWQTGSQLAPSLGALDIKGLVRELKQKSGWFTQLMLLTCIISFVLMQTTPRESYFSLLAFQSFTQVQTTLELWALLTPIIIHFTAAHLLFNLMWFWFLGGRIECFQGSARLIVLTLISGLISNYAQFLVSGAQFGGLSGVVYALLGYCWISGVKNKQSPLALSKPIVVFSLVWLAFGFADLLWIKFANTAHLTGLVCGIVMALLSSNQSHNNETDS